MNRLHLITLALTLAPFAAAHADHPERHDRHDAAPLYYDYAQVVDVDPITRRINITTPEQACWQEEVHYSAHADSASGMILGGILGGVIGHEMAQGRGRDNATLAGAVIGSAIGHDIAHQGRAEASRQTGSRTRCETSQHVRTEERVEAYRVTYRYRGEVFTTTLPYAPRNRLRVRVQVTPVEND